MYDVNYTPDGRTVTSFKEANGANSQHGVNRQTPPPRPAPPEMSKGFTKPIGDSGSNSGQGQQSASASVRIGSWRLSGEMTFASPFYTRPLP